VSPTNGRRPSPRSRRQANPFARQLTCEEVEAREAAAEASSASEPPNRGYRWAFSVTELRSAIIAEGPAILGVNWYESMYDTDEGGMVEVNGNIGGGHCIVAYGYSPAARVAGWRGTTRCPLAQQRSSARAVPPDLVENLGNLAAKSLAGGFEII